MKKTFIYGPITKKSKKASKLKFPAILNGAGCPTVEHPAVLRIDAKNTVTGEVKHLGCIPGTVNLPAPERN